MDAPQPNDLDVTPSPGSIVNAKSSIALYALVVRYAFLVSVGASFLVGAVSAFQFAFGLRRFGGLEYVPRVIVLAAARTLAPAGAFGLTCLTAVTVVHRASRRTASLVALERRRAPFVGGAIVLLYPINLTCIWVGALATMRLRYALSAAAFVASGKDVITWSDFAFGATTTATYAVLATLLLPRLLRIVAASHRGLMVKLIATWLLVHASSFVIQAGAVAAWPAVFTS